MLTPRIAHTERQPCLYLFVCLRKKVGFTDAEREDVASLLVAILHTGNIEFCALVGTDGSQVSDTSADALSNAADTMCVDGKEMATALTQGVVVARGETISTQVSVLAWSGFSF